MFAQVLTWKSASVLGAGEGCDEFAWDIAPGIVNENEDVFKHKKIIGS